jgi:hypothetical protein
MDEQTVNQEPVLKIEGQVDQVWVAPIGTEPPPPFIDEKPSAEWVQIHPSPPEADEESLTNQVFTGLKPSSKLAKNPNKRNLPVAIIEDAKYPIGGDPRVELHSPKNDTMLKKIKNIPGARWNKPTKRSRYDWIPGYWDFPKEYESELRAIVRQFCWVKGEDVPETLLPAWEVRTVRLRAKTMLEKYDGHTQITYAGVTCDGYQLFEFEHMRLRSNSTDAFELLEYKGNVEHKFTKYMVKSKFNVRGERVVATLLYIEELISIYDVRLRCLKTATWAGTNHGTRRKIRGEIEFIGEPEPVLIEGSAKFDVEVEPEPELQPSPTDVIISE